MTQRKTRLLPMLLLLSLCQLHISLGFQNVISLSRSSPASSPASSPSVSSSVSSSPPFQLALQVHNLREADMMEMIVGGERYEMVPLPDSMMDTTLFVSNLCEFTKDDDLSRIFRSVTTLQTGVPACVARKPNMASLGYGFACFATVEETEAAILKFHGSTFMGRSLKVEAIRDHPKRGRVKVPERIVQYVVGAVKKISRKTKGGGCTNGLNTMRRIAYLEEEEEDTPSSSSSGGGGKQKKNGKKSNTPSKELKQRRQQQQQQQRQRGGQRVTSHLSSRNKGITYKLSTPEQDELLRAARRGYVTLNGTGFRRGRKSSALANAHRQYCDEQGRPQIVLCKASGGRPLDCVIVDLSPLRISLASVATDGDKRTDEVFLKWKTVIATAAAIAGMRLRSDYEEDNCHSLSTLDDDYDEGSGMDNISECDPLHDMVHDIDEASSVEHSTITWTNKDAWTTEPIHQLPAVSMGVFEGERSKAKTMARDLAKLCAIPNEPPDSLVNSEKNSADRRSNSSNNNNNRNHQDTERGTHKRDRNTRKDQHRRQRRNNQQDLDIYLR